MTITHEDATPCRKRLKIEGVANRGQEAFDRVAGDFQRQSRIRRSSIFMHRFFLFYLIAFLSVQGAPREVSSRDYLSCLQLAVGQWRMELPALKESASAAAQKVIAGGKLYFGGSQSSFMPEAVGRSGGMALCNVLTVQTQLQPNDVVLAGAMAGRDGKEITALESRVKTAGAQLILFSNLPQASSAGETFFPGKAFEPNPGSGTSVESLSNVTGLWLWIGEFINASIRLGKMPTMLESISMPGGTVRDLLLRKAPFHAHNLLHPGMVPDLASSYLDILETSLDQISRKNRSSFLQAEALLRRNIAARQPIILMSIGHMFPEELSSNPVPDWIKIAPKDYAPTAQSLPFFLGYQSFPFDVPALTGTARVPCIIITSQPPIPDWIADEDHIYIDPCWDIQDAAVGIPGYDIKVMSTSGILESAIFWELIDGVNRSQSNDKKPSNLPAK